MKTRPPMRLRQTLTSLMALAALAPAFAKSPSPSPDKATTLPASLEAGRFYVQPRLTDGRVLRLLTDSGGSVKFTASGAKVLGAEPDPNSNERNPQLLPWPDFQADAWIPKPHNVENGVAVAPLPSELLAAMGDGVIGANWFGERRWEFDYPHRRLRLLAAGELPRSAPEHRVALGFQKDKKGEPTTYFPRIPVRIDGETLQMLFDTGATVMLSEPAVRTLGGGPKVRAGSFIAKTVLERWRKRHPDWRVIENADHGQLRLIEVPELEIGGYTVGPVWFSERSDPSLHEYMSQWMDQRIDGAIGGNAFATLKITVDYPSAVAVFER